MSRKQTLWLGSAVWGSAFIVSGAFAFAMNQPLVHYIDTTKSIERQAPTEVVVATPSQSNVPLTFPALEITVPRAQLAAPVAAPPPAPRGIEQMNCAEWRPLEQGGNAVRECQ
jgi:hypothetical protein